MLRIRKIVYAGRHCEYATRLDAVVKVVHPSCTVCLFVLPVSRARLEKTGGTLIGKSESLLSVLEVNEFWRVFRESTY